MIDVKQIAKPKQTNTGSTMRAASGGVLSQTVREAQHAAKADLAQHADQSDYADRAGYASRAAFADKAFDLDDGSPVNDRFLSKIENDIANGLITFKQGLIP